MAPESDLTLCILGCGNLGQAILSQLVNWEEPPFAQLIACVRSETSYNKLFTRFGVQVVARLAKDAVHEVQHSDVIILGVDPSDVASVLSQPGLADALGEKLLISIAAGWTAERLCEALYGSRERASGQAHILRALPNIAASAAQSLTALAVSPEADLSERHLRLAESIFSRVGKTTQVPPALMNATTAVAGSTPAMFAILCDALIDASVAVGMPRQTAEQMVFQSMRGTAELLQGGMSCAELRDTGTCPEGCTIAAIMIMEEQAVRGAVGKALREAVTVCRQMERVQHVNDTRRA